MKSLNLTKGDPGLIFGIVFNVALNTWTAYMPVETPWVNAVLALVQTGAALALTYQFAWYRGYNHERKMQELYDRYERTRR